MYRGLVDDVKGLPKGRFYNVIDKDVIRTGGYEPADLKARKAAVRSKDTTHIYVYGGLVEDVKNLPRGYGYKVIDKD